MTQLQIIHELKRLRKKWRCAATKEKRRATILYTQQAYASAEKSVGIAIGQESDANDLDQLIDAIATKSNPIAWKNQL